MKKKIKRKIKEKGMNKNIILIGMMGSGKTTIGKQLAEAMHYDFLDTDETILEQTEYASITDLFNEEGEDYFRMLENDLLKKIQHLNKTIIATGGGMIINPENVELLRTMGEIIYLQSTVQNLVSHLDHHSDRPLINKKSMKKDLKKILNRRSETYIKSADIIINVEELTVEDIVNEIIKYYD
jgi:shikimate kinase